ncbi:ABC-three component system protein [Bradyrhizobium sp. 197]|uniref:ABC-three component system protein n=1 Tax=Bradyrhizobium sp. 197 TaxID=2782663 RepID=UPI001FFA69D3
MGAVKTKSSIENLPLPSPWPNANARLLGVGAGLPVDPLDRLGQFSPKAFERFTLEWASGYLASKVPDVYEVQQRGGAGDKGRDVIVWFDPPSSNPRRWSLYQCKHYDSKLGTGVAAAEIAKVLHYTFIGDYSPPKEYWFVTHRGVTSDFQDHVDQPEKLRAYILSEWANRCATEITSKQTIALSADLKAHIETFDFSIFRVKQPLTLIDEHAQTRYHLTVFGAPLIERPPPPTPPSSVAPSESEYIEQLYQIIGADLGKTVATAADFADKEKHADLFDRSRITFYCAEGLKELARDQMADTAYFDTLLFEFRDGLYYDYSAASISGLQRLINTVKAAQALQLGGHALATHVRASDREGMCHQMANERLLNWCKP